VFVAPGALRPLVGFPAVAAAALVAVALLRGWAALLPWGLASCLATYTAALLAAAEGVDPLAPLFAAGLLLAAELAYWSLEERRGPQPRGVVARRAAVALALALATVGLGSILLAAALIRPPGGPAVLAVGVAAAVAAFALLARFAHAPER
jgi:hypothetical protein